MTKANLLEKGIELLEKMGKSPKIQDEGYLKKDDLRKALEPFEFNFNNRTTRTEMINALVCFVKEQKAIADEIAYGNIESQEPAHTQKAQSESQKKTAEFTKKLKQIAAENAAAGYGYTVSDFKFKATVLEVGVGLKEYKGHKNTKEEDELIDRVYSWLVKKNYIKPVLYRIKENDYTRVYTEDYPGRKECRKYRLISMDEAMNSKYTIAEASSFLLL